MSEDSRNSFDPDVLRLLSVAFDEAWDAVPNHLQHPDRLRAVRATQVFELAARGELDPKRLSEEALARTFAGFPARRHRALMGDSDLAVLENLWPLEIRHGLDMCPAIQQPIDAEAIQPVAATVFT